MIVIEGMDSMRAIYLLYGTPIAILLPQLEAVFSSGVFSARGSAGGPQSSRWMPPDGILTI